MQERLLKLGEVDIVFRYPAGRTKRLTKNGKIPYVELPDGGIRIKQSTVERILKGERVDE